MNKKEAINYIEKEGVELDLEFLEYHIQDSIIEAIDKTIRIYLNKDIDSNTFQDWNLSINFKGVAKC